MSPVGVSVGVIDQRTGVGSTGSTGQGAQKPRSVARLAWASVSALGGIRTPNLLIRSQMLYPLSYERSAWVCRRVDGEDQRPGARSEFSACRLRR